MPTATPAPTRDLTPEAKPVQPYPKLDGSLNVFLWEYHERPGFTVLPDGHLVFVDIYLDPERADAVTRFLEDNGVGAPWSDTDKAYPYGNADHFRAELHLDALPALDRLDGIRHVTLVPMPGSGNPCPDARGWPPRCGMPRAIIQFTPEPDRTLSPARPR